MGIPVNKVFIATSLDGYIATVDGSVAFLDTFPAPEGDDMGYFAFMEGIDAILMGRKSFDTVLGFGIPWPYSKPVFVWSQTLEQVPESLRTKVFLVRGSTADVIRQVHEAGYTALYIDGGQTIQSLLQADHIDEMTITIIPVLLGDGIPLFGWLPEMKVFKCTRHTHYPNGLLQNTFVRVAR